MTTPQVSSSLTALQQKVVREIVSLVRRDDLKMGDHLREVQLSTAIGTSRSPVQVALRHLAELGKVYQDANRGFFMAQDARAWEDVADAASDTDDPLYLAIVNESRSGTLGDDVSEADLMRRFNVVRGTLRKILARISNEGWAEQNVGNGWNFLPLINSLEAYEESYLFRLAIEPTSMMLPSFQMDQKQLAQLLIEQRRIVDGGYRVMTPVEIFESNSRFHEALADWSRNRFFSQAVRRVNVQRRLMEYGQPSRSVMRAEQAQEHIEILQSLAQGDNLKAAGIMRAHLDGARRRKAISPQASGA